MAQKRLRQTSSSEAVHSREFAGFSLVETVYAPDFKMPRHTHELAHLSIVLQGGYTEQYGRKDRACEPLLLVLHPPEEDHAVQFHSAGARILGVEVKAEWLEQIRDYSPVLDSPADLRGGLPAWLSVRLYHEFHTPDEVAPLAVEGLALEILAEASRRRVSLSSRKPPRWLVQAREILHAHFSENLSLASVAESVGVHPVYLAREFRKFYHCTMGEYVRRLRIEMACDELSKSNIPLAEIAAAAGFYDQSHFSHTFKRLTGLTPAEYRAVFRSR